MKFLKLYLSIFLFMIAFQTFSQKTWTLRECIDHAIEHNIQVKQSQLNVDLMQVNLLQSKSMMLPDLNVSGTHVYNFGQTVDRFTNEFASDLIQSNNFYVQSRVTLFNGLQMLNTIKKNQFDLLASKYDTDQLRDDISLLVSTSYLQVLYNKELLNNAQNQLIVTKQQIDRIGKMVEAGTLAKGNLLSIESQAAGEELQIVNAQNMLDISYLSLAQLLELPNPDEFEIIAPLVDVIDDNSLSIPVSSIYSTALDNQASIKSAEMQIQSAEKGLAIAKGTRSPSLMLSGSYGTGYSGAASDITKPNFQGYYPNGSITGAGDTVFSPVFSFDEVKPFNEQVNDNSNYSVGVYLTIPIFNGLNSKSSISRAKIASQNADYNYQNVTNQLRKTIQQSHADARAAYNRFQASKKSVEALQEEFSYIEQKYNVGMLTSLEYNDSKNKLNNAKSEQLQAKYEYLFRVKVLDFYMGKPLNL